jgi:hypothetical protein
MRRRFTFLFFVFFAPSLFAGSFIVNFYIRDVSSDSLKTYLQSKKLNGYLIQQNNFEGTILCEKASADQDDAYGNSLGRAISKDLKCRVIYSLIYDSDIYLFSYFSKGELVLSYNSWPGYFEGDEPKPQYGNLDRFCSDFKVDKNKVKSILDNTEKSAFADDIFSQLADAIRAPDVTPYCSYNYMGEIMGDLQKEKCVIVELK